MAAYLLARLGQAALVVAAAKRNYLTTSWWIAIFPGLAILTATLGINLVGDWLRRA